MNKRIGNENTNKSIDRHAKGILNSLKKTGKIKANPHFAKRIGHENRNKALEKNIASIRKSLKKIK